MTVETETCPSPQPLSDLIAASSASCELQDLMRRSVVTVGDGAGGFICDPTFQDEWWALVEERYSTVYVVFTPGLDAGGALNAPTPGGNLVMNTQTATPNITAGPKLHFFKHGMVGVGGFNGVGFSPATGTGNAPLVGDNLPIRLTFAQTNAHENTSSSGVFVGHAVLVAQEFQDYFAIGASIEIGTLFTVDGSGNVPLYDAGALSGYEERVKKSLYEMASFDIDVQIGSGSTDGWRMGPISDWTSPYGQMGHKAYTRGQPMPGSYRKFTSWLQTNSRPQTSPILDQMMFSIALPASINVPNDPMNPTVGQNYYAPIILHLFGLNVCLSEMALKKIEDALDPVNASARARKRRRR